MLRFTRSAVEGSFSKEFSSYISKGDDDGSSSDLSGGEITLIVFLVIIGSILVVSCVGKFEVPLHVFIAYAV